MIYHKLNITNVISGTKGQQVLILQYPIKRGIEKELTALQETYKLGDIHLFSESANIYAISTKPFSKERLQKILKASTAKNKEYLTKCNRLWMPITDEEETIKYIKTLNSKHTPKNASAAHQAFLNKLDIRTTWMNLIGDGNIKYRTTQLRTW